MDITKIKKAMKAGFEARKITFPADAFDEYIDIAAKKIWNAHGWEDACTEYTISCSAGEYRWILPEDYRAYETDTIFLEASGANHPLKIIPRRKFNKDYGDPSNYCNSLPRYAKIAKSGGNTYLYTNSPVSGSYTITLGYFKKYSSLNDLPDPCEIPLIALIEALMVGPGSSQGWSIMGTYEDKLLPQAIEEDQRIRGVPDAMEGEYPTSGFQMEEGYGG